MVYLNNFSLQTVVQNPFISTSKACPQLDSSLAVIANPIVHIISKPFSPLPNTHIHKVNQNYKRYLSLPLPLPLLSFSLCKSKMKRKWEDPQGENFNSPTDNIELHLETPLPLEWQRCLDIQVYDSLTFKCHEILVFQYYIILFSYYFLLFVSSFCFKVRRDTFLQHKDSKENLNGSKKK